FNYKKLKNNRTIIMNESSDTACENILIASALIPGKTIIKYASSNYMVQEMCFFLEKLGVKIDGIGTSTLVVHSFPRLDLKNSKRSDLRKSPNLTPLYVKNIEYTNSEDPIESMMWLTAAIVTNSKLEIKKCPIDFLELELYKLKKMGLKYKILKSYKSKNEKTNLVDILVFPSVLKALEDKIEAKPYPGINIDNLPFFGIIAACAKGETLIHDWVFENRAIYLTELNKLNANVSLTDPHRVFIKGPTKFTPTQVICPPALRPSVVIMLAMIAAPGKSILRNVYMINRGYENIVERFNSIGAKIKITQD
ncbi:MAG: UDP-N-acetylglucosamine 1-carboxyvinyltransferase, partial [Patescibacteria group bacterium]